MCGGLDTNYFSQNAAQELGITLRGMDETFFFTDTMMLNRLVTHDSSVDIYYLEGGFVSTDVVFRKDFAAPLTNPELLEEIAAMYAPIRTAVTQGQTVMGAPVFVASQEYCLGYSLEVYEKALEEGYVLPASWLELLQQIAQWDDALWQQQISPVNMTPHMLVQVSLDFAMAQQQARGEEVQFDAADTVEVVEAAYRAGQNMTAHQSDRMEHILFWRQGMPIGHSEMEGFSAHVLPLREGDALAIPMRLCVAIINPYSKKQDLAQEFLAACYHQMDPMLHMKLTPGANAEIANPSAQAEIAQLQQNISRVENLLAQGGENLNLKDLELQLSECKERLAFVEANSNRVDAASLAAYAAYMESGVVLTWQLWQDQTVSQLVDRLIQGQLTAEAFCQELERVAQMMEAERS